MRKINIQAIEPVRSACLTNFHSPNHKNCNRGIFVQRLAVEITLVNKATIDDIQP